MTRCEVPRCPRTVLATVRHPDRGRNGTPECLQVCERHAEIIVEECGGEVVDE